MVVVVNDVDVTGVGGGVDRGRMVVAVMLLVAV